ncbi:MAG: acetyl-CoA carboxylase biotin carboxyl carrier protein subunit [Candidatus Hodarchaeota archaeon]
MSEVFTFDNGEKRFEVRLRRDEHNSFFVVVRDENEEEREVQVNAKVLGEGQFQFTLGTIIYKCTVAKDGNKRFIHIDGQDYELKRVSELEDEFEAVEEEKGRLTSPMPGRIVKLLVKPGDRVKKGQELIIIEAMKMENKICAPYNGIVSRVYYPVGDQIEANVALMDIEEESESGEEVVSED